MANTLSDKRQKQFYKLDEKDLPGFFNTLSQQSRFRGINEAYRRWSQSDSALTRIELGQNIDKWEKGGKFKETQIKRNNRIVSSMQNWQLYLLLAAGILTVGGVVLWTVM